MNFIVERLKRFLAIFLHANQEMARETVIIDALRGIAALSVLRSWVPGGAIRGKA